MSTISYYIIKGSVAPTVLQHRTSARACAHDFLLHLHAIVCAARKFGDFCLQKPVGQIAGVARTSSSSLTTLAWALFRAVSKMSMWFRCSCRVALCACSSMSLRSFSAESSLSARKRTGRSVPLTREDVRENRRKSKNSSYT